MFRIAALGTLGVYWTAIFVGTHLPDGIRGLGQFYDKFLHFGAYAGLAFLLAATLTVLRRRRGALLLPLAIAAIYGCVDELSQRAVPGRHAGIDDWIADVLGAGVGVIAFSLMSFAIVKFFARSTTPECQTVTKSAA